MRYRVFETVERPSVLSIDSSSGVRRVCCWAPCGKRGQRHVDSPGTTMNTNSKLPCESFSRVLWNTDGISCSQVATKPTPDSSRHFYWSKSMTAERLERWWVHVNSYSLTSATFANIINSCHRQMNWNAASHKLATHVLNRRRKATDTQA